MLNEVNMARVISRPRVAERVAAAATAPHIAERQRPNGKTLLLRGEPLHDKGFVTLYSDVTDSAISKT